MTPPQLETLAIRHLHKKVPGDTSIRKKKKKRSKIVTRHVRECETCQRWKLVILPTLEQTWIDWHINGLRRTSIFQFHEHLKNTYHLILKVTFGLSISHINSRVLIEPTYPTLVFAPNNCTSMKLKNAIPFRLLTKITFVTLGWLLRDLHVRRTI